MSKYYDRRGSARVANKSGIFGKILALFLGLLLGIIACLGGIAGVIYYFTAKVSINKTVDAVESISKTEINISEVLTDEYASKTVLQLIGDLQTVAKEFKEGSGSFDTLNKISPAVEKSVQKLVDQAAKYGLELELREFMETPFKSLSAYLTDEVNGLKVDALLDKLEVAIDSPILRALCFGEEGVDYEIDENGDVQMIGDAQSKTIGELKDIENVMNNMSLHSMFNSETFNVKDPIMGALAFGPQSHYTVETVDGKDKVVMKRISFEYDGTNFTDVDGAQYTVTENGENYIATYQNEDGETTTYNVKEIEGEYYAYDEETGDVLTYKKTTVGDLINGDPTKLMDPIEIGKMMEINANSNKVLLTLAYGIEGEDYEIENGEIKMLGDSKPRTIGDLMGDELNDMLDTLPIASLMEIDVESELLLAIAYGAKSHYEIVETTDAEGNVVKEVQMKEITFTLDGDTFTENADGKEYTYVQENGGYTLTPADGTEAAYFVKVLNDKDGNPYYVAYDAEEETAVKYEKTTLSMLQEDPSGILNQVELGSAMNVTPDSNKVLIAIAYGNEGEDFDYILDKDGKKIGFEMKDGKKPMTIGDMQDNDTLNETIETLPLDMLLEVDYNDKMICALAYGPSSHYTFEYAADGKTVVGVKMNEIVFEYDGANFTDADGAQYTVTENGENYIAAYQDEDGETTTYHVKEIEGKYYAYDEETGDVLTYKKTTVGELQDDPSAVLNNIALGEALDLTPASDPIMIALAYGNEGEDFDYEYDENGNKLGFKMIEPAKPRTLKDLQGNSALFREIRLATVLSVDPLDPKADSIMVALAYGNKGEHYDIQTVNGKETVVMLPMEYSYDSAASAFTDGNGKVYTAAQNGNVWTAVSGEETIYIVENNGEYVAYTSEERNEETIVRYAPRVVDDLQGDSGVIKSMQLATVLNVTPASDSIMIALAYGNEGEDFDYVYDETGSKIDFKMKDGKKPRTVEELQDENATLFKDIRLSTVMTPDYGDQMIMYIVYGGGEGAHYEFTYDANDPTVKTGVTMLEQRIGILTVEDATYVYDEYGFLLTEGYTLIANGDGSYTYTDENGAVYTAKRSAENETLNGVEYKDGNGEMQTASANVYWLYDENGTLLYYAPATIGDMQDGKDISSITNHLTIRQLVGESNAQLFQTVGDWHITDLQDQDKIMTLKIGEVITVDENSTGILAAMKDWSLNDLNDQQKINGLKVSEIVSIADDSPKVLRFMKEQEWTLGDLNDETTFNTIALGNVIDIGEDDNILKHLKDTPIGNLTAELDRLSVQKIFVDQVYRKFQDDAYLTTYHDQTTNEEYLIYRVTVETQPDECPRVYTNEDGAYYYIDGNGNRVDLGDYIDDSGNLILIDGEKANDQTILTAEKRALVGSWRYLLTVDKTDDGIHNPLEEEYTITHIEQLVANMKKNIEEATLQELKHDGMIEDLDETTLKTNIIRDIGGIPIDVASIPADKKTLGELTVMEMLNYVNAIIQTITSPPTLP